MPEHVSPEEKLLKLIRRKDKAEPSQDHAAASPKAQKSSFNAGVMFGVAGKMLILGIVGLSGYIGYEFFFTGQNMNLTLEKVQTPAFQEIADTTVLADIKPYTYYTDIIQTRDIFESPLYGKNQKKGEEIQKVSSLPELTQNLKLVGIILDKNSVAVIEDVQGQKTFFLHKGEEIKNATVENIEEGKVTLLYGGKMVELTP